MLQHDADGVIQEERPTEHNAPGVSNMKLSELPLVERFRIVANQYSDAEAAAEFMDEMKTTTLEEKKSVLMKKYGDMPENKAERLVKAGGEWREYITEMCRHKARARKLKLHLEYLRMRERKEDRENWNARTEMRMGRSAT